MSKTALGIAPHVTTFSLVPNLVFCASRLWSVTFAFVHHRLFEFMTPIHTSSDSNVAFKRSQDANMNPYVVSAYVVCDQVHICRIIFERQRGHLSPQAGSSHSPTHFGKSTSPFLSLLMRAPRNYF